MVRRGYEKKKLVLVRSGEGLTTKGMEGSGVCECVVEGENVGLKTKMKNGDQHDLFCGRVDKIEKAKKRSKASVRLIFKG